jgi:hypothetical protein
MSNMKTKKMLVAITHLTFFCELFFTNLSILVNNYSIESKNKQR